MQQLPAGFNSHHAGRFTIPSMGRLIGAGNLARTFTAPAASTAVAAAEIGAPSPLATPFAMSPQISQSGGPLLEYQQQQQQQSLQQHSVQQPQHEQSFSLVGAECEVNLTFRAGDGQLYEATVVARRVTPELGQTDAAAAAAAGAAAAAAAAAAVSSRCGRQLHLKLWKPWIETRFRTTFAGTPAAAGPIP